MHFCIAAYEIVAKIPFNIAAKLFGYDFKMKMMLVSVTYTFKTFIRSSEQNQTQFEYDPRIQTMWVFVLRTSTCTCTQDIRTVFCRTEPKSNTVPMRQKITRYRYWQRAPLHTHTPRAARNRKERRIRSAVSSNFSETAERRTYL